MTDVCSLLSFNANHNTIDEVYIKREHIFRYASKETFQIFHQLHNKEISHKRSNWLNVKQFSGILHDVFKRVLTKYKIYEHFVVANTITRLICYFILWVYVYDITAIYSTESLTVDHSQDLFCRFVRAVVLCNCNHCKNISYAFSSWSQKVVTRMSHPYLYF